VKMPTLPFSCRRARQLSRLIFGGVRFDEGGDPVVQFADAIVSSTSWVSKGGVKQSKETATSPAARHPALDQRAAAASGTSPPAGHAASFRSRRLPRERPRLCDQAARRSGRHIPEKDHFRTINHQAQASQ
jgi:hypothetical protein